MRYTFIEIGKILQKLHKAGFAHGDLKPENIIVTKELDFKLSAMSLKLKRTSLSTSNFSN